MNQFSMPVLAKIGCGIIICWLMVGCSAKDIVKFDVDIAKTQALAASDCRKSRAVDLSLVPKEDRAFAVMNHSTMEMVLMITGHDPCAQTNVYDSQIAEVVAKNKALEKGTGTLANLGMAYFLTDFGKTALQEAGDSYRASEYGDVVVDKDSYNTSNKDSGNTSNKDSGNTFADSPVQSSIPTTTTTTTSTASVSSGTL